MPAAGSSHAEQRSFQQDGAVQIGPKRASENPDKAEWPVSPVRRCRVQSSKSYKRHNSARQRSEGKRKRKKNKHTQTVSLLANSYLIFVHLRPAQHTAPPPLYRSAPDRLAVCPSASDNRGSCCHSRFLGAPSVRAAARKVK